jgi:hypothetical protein
MVALSGFDWQGKTGLNSWWTDLGSNNSSISVNVTAATPLKTGDTTFTVAVTCSVGPTTTPSSSDPGVAVKTVYLTYIVVFYP